MNQYKSWTRAEEGTLRKIYPQFGAVGVNQQLLHRTKHAINEWARKLGVRCHESLMRRGTLKPLLEETNKAYYWMGFICADGWISHKTGQLVIVLSEKDLDHLKKIAELLQTKLYRMPPSSNPGYRTNKPMFRIAIQDQDVAKQIIKKFGLQDRKTENPPKLPTMTRDKFLSFWTGFVDGDGSIFRIGKYKYAHIAIQCHKNWLELLQKFSDGLNRYFGFTNKRLARLNGGYATLRIARQPLIEHFASWTKEKQLPRLERKWRKI